MAQLFKLIVEQTFREDSVQDIVDGVIEYSGMDYKEASFVVKNLVNEIYLAVEAKFKEQVYAEALEDAQEKIEEKIGVAARTILMAIGE